MMATNSIRARPVLRELRRSRSDAEHPAFQVPSLNLDSTLEVQMPEIATVERTVHNELPDLQQRIDVGDRKQAVAAIDGGGERSERVSPASVNGLHSVASAGTTASREGRGDARDSVGLTRVASTCTSSSVPWQGDAPPSFATLPVLALSPSVRVVPLVVSARLPRCGRGPSRGENENGAFFRLGTTNQVALAGDHRRNAPWTTVSRS